MKSSEALNNSFFLCVSHPSKQTDSVERKQNRRGKKLTDEAADDDGSGRIRAYLEPKTDPKILRPGACTIKLFAAVIYGFL